MANGWAPIIGLIVVVIFCVAAWVLAPKGENQTYVYRTIPPSKANGTPTKPCLRAKSSSENLDASEKKLYSAATTVGGGGGGNGGSKRVHFAQDTRNRARDAEPCDAPCVAAEKTT
ncbi:hypothetical protein yc1106_00831 [Curvularia clavata]|uniref:Uncharacterized protein n=1 Tax=Curvularia clavata TaxID=95742 RepID=A0A9Q8Z053_CURCL|nr:hypothetical protein yc1106_00831 [Curvularia clavata]